MSPETYIGYGRGERRTEGKPTELALNQWTLTGRWTVEEESAVLDGAGSMAYRSEGRDLNLVLATAGDTEAAPFTILLDGEPPGPDSGFDVDKSGAGIVTAPRMYQLVRQHAPIRPRTFEMQFPDAGVRAYVFTFG